MTDIGKQAEERTPTKREFQIIAMLGKGLCSKEIAVALDLSLKTVETHRANIYLKMGFHSWADVIHYALARGLCANKYQSEVFNGS